MSNYKGVIGILTGGGDVPGLNPAIRAVTVRAIREGFKVIGIRKGWEGLINIDRNKPLDQQAYCSVLTEESVNKIARSGGTFLHSSRTKPSVVKKNSVPDHLKDKYNNDVNDLTPEVMENLNYMGMEYLIAIG